ENLRTPPVFWPQLLALQAEACALSGRPADALELLDRAAGVAAEGSFDSANLKVQRADVLVSLDDAAGAESWLLRAFHEAGGAGARMIQLRAATRLARLAETTGRGDATAMLLEVFETFTEGFDTPQLLEARAVLNDAAAGGP
ncbi:MAG: hypothetical protein M3168_05675, partial [Actinomycetota bacterium]|nr:hypothetical protein [Actinomycetota bacterium]